MKPNDPQDRAYMLAQASLSAVRKLSAEGKGLSIEDIAQLLRADGTLSDMLAPPADKFQRDEFLRQKKEVDTLKGQLEKSVANRRQLTAQLDTLEHQETKGRELMQRTLPTLIQLIPTAGNKPLEAALSKIQDLTKKNAPIDQLEAAFLPLKGAAFKDELHSQDHKSSSGKSGLFSLFKRHGAGAGDSLAHFREMYLDILHELRLNLDQGTLQDLTDLERRLQEVQEITGFAKIRKDLLKLLKAFLSRMNADRGQAASFILEVGERLLEVERQLMHSMTAAKETENANARFTSTIEQEMASVQNAVDVTKTLEDLKARVVASIALIKTAIENSRKEEWTRTQKTDEELSALNQNIDRMKLEMAGARKRSEILECELLTDPLTGAHNRRAYDQRIEEELKRYQRYQTPFSLLMLDVDHFKHINDRYGHAVGDLCLKEIIKRIKPLLRSNDFLARYGGEEFVIFLPETPTAGAEKTAEKIRLLIEKTEFLHKGDQVKVTISIGVTEVRPEDTSGDTLFERADKALYQAKGSGRNRVMSA